MKIPANTAAKATQTGEKSPAIVPNAPQVAQNPVPATERDTPVLIQYTAPEAAASTPGPITLASQSEARTADVVSKATDLLQAVADITGGAASTSHLTTVKMLQNHPKVGAFKGTVTKLPAALAAELIASEYAVAATDEDGTTETSGYTETI
ncbi:MAG: hypothetical protein ACRYFV_13675 [Janthinobacterium lividum]